MPSKKIRHEKKAGAIYRSEIAEEKRQNERTLNNAKKYVDALEDPKNFYDYKDPHTMEMKRRRINDKKHCS